MKPRTLLGAIALALLAFSVGRYGFPASSTPVAGSRETPVAQRVQQDAPAGDETPAGEEATRRTQRRPAGYQVQRVSIPVAAVIEILKQSQFASCDFNQLNRNMPDALTLLGVSASDKKAALEVMTRGRERMLALERANLKIASESPTQIVLDHHLMEGPAREVAEETRQGLRDALPADIGEALVGSIDWDRYYTDTTTTFQVFRDAEGKYVASERTPNHAFRIGLTEDQIQASSSFDAGEIYDARWKSLLEGRRLTPVDK